MRLLCLAFVLWVIPVFSHTTEATTLPATDVSVTARDGTELTLYQYPAQGDYLILWIGSGYGFNERTIQTARNFAANGMEVWKIDFAEALFQTSSSNFLRNLNADYVVDIIEDAHRQTGKKIVLFARAYGAIPVLRGATLWQQKQNTRANLLGAVLLSPDLYASIPSLGQDPDYLPITRYTTLPLFILQAGKRGTAWQLPRLLTQLQQTNQSVYFSVMQGVSGVLYPDDNSPETLARLASLPTDMPGIIRLLERTPYPKLDVGYSQTQTPYQARLDNQLKPFKANPTPAAIRLTDINGNPFALTDYTGQVTIVNFWATWCPPCVEEIPSLNRLREKMAGKSFRLISINYAESRQTVAQFMQRVNVEFPVLMDVDGKVAAQWNVIAFPSTFVIGKDGNIKYGINAAIRWDAPDIIRTLDALIK